MRLLETALYVADLERSVEFYQRVFGFAALDSEGPRMRTLAVAQTPGGGWQHLVFAIDAGKREPRERRLRELGVPLEPVLPRS